MVDSVSKENFISCPICENSVQKNSIKCRYCGSTLDPFFENIGGSHSPIQSVKTVKNIEKTDDSKPNTEVINSKSLNRYWGHGWGIFLASLIFLVSILSSAIEKNEELMIAFGIICPVIIIPWFLWIMSKSVANKILPIIAILISSFTVFGFF